MKAKQANLLAAEAREIALAKLKGDLPLILSEIEARSRNGATWLVWRRSAMHPNVINELRDLGYRVNNDPVSSGFIIEW